ncbi:hypothetical protein [Chitinophaga defluvii]|uniref:Uncharacterized protein n=1 Tax=Chitinophaga defluvii TaxID=3163343 RepID=A0ABV2TBA1_9BACT
MRKSRFGITLVVALLAACLTFAATDKKDPVADCYTSATVTPPLPPAGAHTRPIDPAINSTPAGNVPNDCTGTAKFCCYQFNAAHTQIVAVVFQN